MFSALAFLLFSGFSLQCIDYGVDQVCDAEADGACQIGCGVARCDGGKCDQRDAKTCKCDGGTCWQENCGSTECDGGHCSTDSTPPEGCISPSCTGTTTSSTTTPHGGLSCAAYGTTEDCKASKDGACQIGCEVAHCDGGKCDQRNAKNCYCDGGNCWQKGCDSTSCDGGSCGAGNDPPPGCIAVSCTGTTTSSTHPPQKKKCEDYGVKQDCSGADDGACQIDCNTAGCDGGKCDQRSSKACKCDGGNCWQLGCQYRSCDGGNCSSDYTPPDGCISPSCHPKIKRNVTRTA